MRAEYDFTTGVRGKHHEAYRAGTNVVFLEPDLIEAFPDSESVNQALRLLVKLSRKALGGSRHGKPAPPNRPRKKAKSKGRSRTARG
jgi:hypothetical protein